MTAEARRPPIGHEIVRLDEVDSTNTLGLEHPTYRDRHGLVLLARHQTGGRGRMGRRWASVPGHQLQFSIVLHPAFPAADFPLVGLIAGLAVAEALQEALGGAPRGALPEPPRLKWPNDVLLAGRKVCGILVDGTGAGGMQPRLVLGIGINCNGASTDFPPELHAQLTTLAEAVGHAVDAEIVLGAVLARLNARYDALAAGSKAALLADWRAWALLGPPVRVRVSTQAGLREGTPEDVTSEGYLIVRYPDGSQSVQVSGTLEWLLPSRTR